MPHNQIRISGRDRLPVIGITGGMGAGKSLAARVFQQCGAVLIDADSVGHEILSHNTTVQRALIERFGADIQSPDGTVNRTILGPRVFADEQGVDDLNGIMHPAMIDCIKRRVLGMLRSRNYEMVVVDAALLFEAHVERYFDYILVVTAPEDRRIEWIRRRSGLDVSEIRQRLLQQISQETKAEHAHLILENTSTPDALKAYAATVYTRILKHFHEGIPLS